MSLGLSKPMAALVILVVAVLALLIFLGFFLGGFTALKSLAIKSLFE